MVRAFRLVRPTLLWVSCVHSFYIWTPPKLCPDDAGCDGVDENHDRRAIRVGGGITMDLHQRKPPNDEDVAKRAALSAGRLLRKYGTVKGTRTQPQLDERTQNTYSIIMAAKPTAANTAAVDQDGTDFSFFVEAELGSEDKLVRLLLDSGAGTSWVMGPDCRSDACTLHSSFGPGDSKTYVPSDETFSIAYGSGSVMGHLVEDTLSFASIDTKMTFGVANETSKEFTQFAFDGILGLSMSKGATDNYVQTLREDKVLTANIFSVTLGRASEGSSAGEITFGATDPGKFTGEISYTPLAQDAGGDWAIPLGDIGYDGKTAGIKNRVAYIDTGTSFAFGPAGDVAALHKLIPGAKSSNGVEYTVPCSSNLELAATFSGVSYKISAADWLSGGGTSCTSNIFGHEVVSGAWLLGDTFLKNVYAVFDMDNKRIGFADKAVSAPPRVTTTAAPPASTELSDAVITISAQSRATTQLSTEVGLGGHEASATSAPAAAGTLATPSVNPTQPSPGEPLVAGKFVLVVAFAATFLAMIV